MPLPASSSRPIDTFHAKVTLVTTHASIIHPYTAKNLVMKALSGTCRTSTLIPSGRVGLGSSRNKAPWSLPSRGSFVHSLDLSKASRSLDPSLSPTYSADRSMYLTACRMSSTSHSWPNRTAKPTSTLRTRTFGIFASIMRRWWMSLSLISLTGEGSSKLGSCGHMSIVIPILRLGHSAEFPLLRVRHR